MFLNLDWFLRFGAAHRYRFRGKLTGVKCLLQAAYVRTIPTSVIRFTRRRIKGPFRLSHPSTPSVRVVPKAPRRPSPRVHRKVGQPPPPKPNCAKAQAGGTGRGQAPLRSECPNSHQSQGRSHPPQKKGTTTKKASPVSYAHSGRATRGLSLPRKGAWIATEKNFSPRNRGRIVHRMEGPTFLFDENGARTPTRLASSHSNLNVTPRPTPRPRHARLRLQTLLPIPLPEERDSSTIQ